MFLSDGSRFDKAISEIKKAQEIDPLSLVITRNLGFVYYMARRPDEAIETSKQVIEMDPTFPGVHGTLAEAYLQKSMFREALDEIAEEKAHHSDPASLSYIEPLTGLIYVRLGNEDKAREILDDQLKHLGEPFVSEVDLATLCFALGEDEKGFDLLETAAATGGRMLWMLGAWPEFDCVRSHPRFIALLRKFGLAE
jgi:tetratricopeptide (TPR) repeat protein